MTAGHIHNQSFVMNILQEEYDYRAYVEVKLMTIIHIIYLKQSTG